MHSVYIAHCLSCFHQDLSWRVIVLNFNVQPRFLIVRQCPVLQFQSTRYNENVFMLFAAPLVSAADNSQTDFAAETVCRLFTDFDCRNDDNLLISLRSAPVY